MGSLAAVKKARPVRGCQCSWEFFNRTVAKFAPVWSAKVRFATAKIALVPVQQRVLRIGRAKGLVIGPLRFGRLRGCGGALLFSASIRCCASGPHAKPVSYLVFLGVLAVWPPTTFGAAGGLDAAAASADLAAAALVRRTPG